MAQLEDGTTRTTEGGISSPFGDYFRDIFERGAAASKAPFTKYTGDRVAGLSDLEKASQAGIAGLKGFEPTQYTSKSFTDPGVAGLYMSPYQQGVTDIAKREAQRTADIKGTQLGANAVNQGAFGGYRHGLVEAEHGRNTGQLLNDIQTKGLQSAYEMGMKQFESEAERNQRMQYLQDLANRYEYTSGIEALKLKGEAGRLPRELAQKDLDFDFSEFTRAEEDPYKKLNFLKGITSVLPGSAYTTTREESDITYNPYAQGAGAAMGAYDFFTKPPTTPTTTTPTGGSSVPNYSYSAPVDYNALGASEYAQGSDQPYPVRR
jgi:hypothetical protein